MIFLLFFKISPETAGAGYFLGPIIEIYTPSHHLGPFAVCFEPYLMKNVDFENFGFSTWRTHVCCRMQVLTKVAIFW